MTARKGFCLKASEHYHRRYTCEKFSKLGEGREILQRAFNTQKFEAKGPRAGAKFCALCMNCGGKEESGAR